jgi:hypothetical protein
MASVIGVAVLVLFIRDPRGSTALVAGNDASPETMILIFVLIGLGAVFAVLPHQLRPRLRRRQILRWADAWYRAKGKWPTPSSGRIPGTNGETWEEVDLALEQGRRGLPGGSSLFALLVRYRTPKKVCE